MIGQMVKKLSTATWMPLELALLPVKITVSIIVAGFRQLVLPPKKSLVGETVLVYESLLRKAVTGAGHGIGRELAVQLAIMGCTVVCWDINRAANESTKNEILNKKGEVYDFVVDVSSRFEVRETAKLMKKLGVPDITILINNAATLRHKPFLNHGSDDVYETFDVNVFSHFWTIQTFLPMMIRDGRGHIVCMCSLCGIYGVSQKVAYCSSKFAIRGLMNSLREEFSSQQLLNFTNIYPFYVDTGLANDPEYRFPVLFGAISPQYAAQEVIKAMQRNYKEYVIPRSLFLLNYILGILPDTSREIILNFLSSKSRT